MFTLRLTIHGRPIEPTEHESFADLGDTLASALNDAGIGLKPPVISVLCSLMFNDLRARQNWGWVAEEYEIFVSRDGP